MTRAERWLDLIAFLLQHRVPLTEDRILHAVEGYRLALDGGASPAAVRRLFEQDRNRLKKLGVGIETVGLPDRGGTDVTAYRLRPGAFYLPYLELEPAPTTAERPARPIRELRTLKISRRDLAVLERATGRLAGRPDFPLAAAAAAARRKLGFDLPLTVAQVERILGGLSMRRDAQAVDVLQRAVALRRRVLVTYYSIGRETQERLELEPSGLFFNRGLWYCVARSSGLSEWRVLRVDRMREARMLESRFTPPAEFNLAGYVGRLPWELAGSPPVRVRVRFAFPESRWVLAQHVGQVREALAADGAAVLEFQVSEAGPFLRWLLTFRDHAEVQEPAAVAAALERLRRQVAALYAEGARA